LLIEFFDRSKRCIKREGSIVRVFAICAIVFFCGTWGAAAYTQADASACTPDALRLCAAYIPNAKAIESCLRANRARLSSACFTVFEPAALKSRAEAKGAYVPR
jgi:hypothetical protein